MPPPARPEDRRVSTKELFEQLPRTLALVWKADKASALGVAALTLLQALLPGALAWVGKLIIDAVVLAAKGG
jgi:hypothetical protein